MKLFGIVFTFFISFSAQASDTYSYGFPPMEARYLNRMLVSALHNMGCKISSHLGVQGDSRHMQNNPGSCHNVARAIDIATLSCENEKSNEENLRVLASYFTVNPFILICYKDIGPILGSCRAGHGNHLHFGAREGLRCTSPLPF
jgi:hypothetical protein